jgi:hypothetical protein
MEHLPQKPNQPKEIKLEAIPAKLTLDAQDVIHIINLRKVLSALPSPDQKALADYVKGFQKTDVNQLLAQIRFSSDHEWIVNPDYYRAIVKVLEERHTID